MKEKSLFVFNVVQDRGFLFPLDKSTGLEDDLGEDWVVVAAREFKKIDFAAGIPSDWDKDEILFVNLGLLVKGNIVQNRDEVILEKRAVVVFPRGNVQQTGSIFSDHTQ